MGCQVSAAVAPSKAPILEAVPAGQVKLGDLEDLELAARENGVDLVICNSHAAETAKRLGVPLFRAGFPQYDLIGGYQRLWIGYRGTRQALFDLANLLVEHGHHEAAPYQSVYATRLDTPLWKRGEGGIHAASEVLAGSEIPPGPPLAKGGVANPGSNHASPAPGHVH